MSVGKSVSLSPIATWITTTTSRVPWRRVVLLAVAAGITALGTALNWSWLSAVGAAPLILAILPCAAMCALGLCMPGMGRKTPPAALPTENVGAEESEHK